MNILTLSTSDISGGAARAAYNLFKSLKDLGIDSRMVVSSKYSQDYQVQGPKTKLKKIFAMAAMYIDALPNKLFTTNNSNLHSPAWFSNGNVRAINNLDVDIVHLHWVQGGFLSVKAISKIRKPIVWTLHDMWAFSGAEHYSNGSKRYREGYSKHNRPVGESGLDINRWVWERKIKAFRSLKNLTIVTPSKWMADCASKSVLLKDRKIEVIPVGLDHSLYRPRDKKIIREILGMPTDKNVILIGAMNFLKDKRKGGHLLKEAFQKLCDTGLDRDTELYVLGTSNPQHDEGFGFKTHYFGAGRDDLSLALLYSAVDVFVAPSIEENFAATVFESLSCGIPVVAFDIGGMPDMITHKENGYLAVPFDTTDLAKGIHWVLKQAPKSQLSENARSFIERECTLEIQAQRYKAVYDNVLRDTR